jgi:hypothetical protein
MALKSMRSPQEVQTYFGDVAPPNGTPILADARGVRYWGIPQGTQLIRGVNLNCSMIRTPVRNDAEPTWFAWKPRTAKLYSRATGCINGFRTQHPLILLHLWNPYTAQFIASEIQKPQYTQLEKEAFAVYTGFGVDKSFRPGEDSPQVTLAKRNGWTGINTTNEAVRGILPQVTNQRAVVTRHGYETDVIDYLGFTWGAIENPNAANRISIYQCDMIVINLLRKMFPQVDGVLSPPLPSLGHGGVFHEELVLFPIISQKVTPIGSVNPSQIAGFFRRRTGKKKTRKQTRRNLIIK